MLLTLSIILFLLIMFIGGERGLRSFFVLFLNIIFLFIAIVFLSLGLNPYVITLLVSVIFVTITLLYQNGINLKTFSALFSVLIVMILLSVFCALITNKSKIAGYNEADELEDSLIYLSTNIAIKMDDVMVCVILLGMLGAIMDTAIAISSAVYEIFRNNPDFTTKQLIFSGKNVGNDILGTTANTLFFACIGECVMLSLFFVKTNYSFAKLINSKAFFQEYVTIIMSNIGCFLIIPISYIIISYLLKSQKATKLRDFCNKIEEKYKTATH